MKRWEARRFAKVIEALAAQLGALWQDAPPRLDAPDLSPDVAPDIEAALRTAHRALVDLGWKDPVPDVRTVELDGRPPASGVLTPRRPVVMPDRIDR